MVEKYMKNQRITKQKTYTKKKRRKNGKMKVNNLTQND